jgi:hypothetical protein
LENLKVINEGFSVDASWSWRVVIVGGFKDIIVADRLLRIEGEWSDIILELSVVSSS